MKKLLGCLLGVLLTIGLAIGPAQAITIDFVGFSGGSLSYAGGLAPLIGSNLPINLVFSIPPGGSSAQPVSWALNFTTGNFTGGQNLGGAVIQNSYGPGGSLSITGGGSTFLSANFNGANFIATPGTGFANFGGSLTNTVVNPLLTNFFNTSQISNGVGTLALALNQGVQFAGNNPDAGIGFTGSQASVNVAVAGKLSTPSSLLLLGIGLVALGWAQRRR